MKAIVYALVTAAAINPVHAEVQLLDRNCVAALAYSVEPDLFRPQVSNAFEVFFDTAMAEIEPENKQLYYWGFLDACIDDMELTLSEAILIARESLRAQTSD